MNLSYLVNRINAGHTTTANMGYCKCWLTAINEDFQLNKITVGGQRFGSKIPHDMARTIIGNRPKLEKNRI